MFELWNISEHLWLRSSDTGKMDEVASGNLWDLATCRRTGPSEGRTVAIALENTAVVGKMKSTCHPWAFYCGSSPSQWRLYSFK